MRFRQSRLSKVEEKKSLKQAILFFILTIFLLLTVFFVGMPLIIKFAVYLGSWQKTSLPGQNSDNLPLTQPRLLPLPEATNSSQITINGFAPAGAKIRLYLNNKLIQELISDNQGEFKLKKLSLQKGTNIIKAVSVDSDKESEPYETKIFYKTEPPKLEINSPKDNDNFFDEDKEILVTGSSDPDTQVLVNEHYAIVDSNGNFSLRIILNEGENPIKVISNDQAGNKTETQIKVYYTP